MAAHADETDDSHAPSQTHPGCGIVPVVTSRLDGKDWYYWSGTSFATPRMHLGYRRARVIAT